MHSSALNRRSFVAAGALAAASLIAPAAAHADEAPASKPAILVVSFGTSYNESRHVTIGAIESAIREAYPTYDVRRAFTAQTIIDKLKERDGVEIDNVEEALDRLIADGVKQLVVQPTHLMDGYEYTDLVNALQAYANKFDAIALGSPLLTTDADFEAVIATITAATAPYDDGETAICFMGHGTEASSNAVYTKLQEMLAADGFANYIVTTVEAEPTFDDAVEAVVAGGYTKAVLRPLMVVAGDHATNDMADTQDPESLASLLLAAGVENITCILEGLGQLVGIDELYVAHVAEAMALL